VKWLPWLRGTPLEDVRWVVLDTETSGLDASSASLLSVGAVAVRGRRVILAESFHRKIRQDAPSDSSNIVIHGIGADAQLAGDLAAEALPEFCSFLEGGRPVGFNASFDEEILRRAGRPWGLKVARGWLDLARLAPAVEPRRARNHHRSLDDWLEVWGIQAQPRHDALADALATAELLLVLLDRATGQGARTDRDLLLLADGARWLT
jgi:DNA polymerase-3 subunit epsilon